MLINPLAPFLQLFLVLARRAPWRFTLGLLVAFGVTALLVTFDTSPVETALATMSTLTQTFVRLSLTLARVIAVGLSLVGLMALILARFKRYPHDHSDT